MPAGFIESVHLWNFSSIAACILRLDPFSSGVPANAVTQITDGSDADYNSASNCS